MRFQRTSPCYLGMEARRHVEFTNVELTSGMDRYSGGEDRPRSCGEGCGGSARWRSQRAGGTVEKEEDGLLCSGAEAEMPARGAEARWRGRHGGEGRVVESAVAEAVHRSVVAVRCRGAEVR